MHVLCFARQLARRNHPLRTGVLAAALWMLGCAASVAHAQVPIPNNKTPTINGATPIVGNAVAGDIGFAQLRAGLYLGGGGNRDVGIQMALPTFGHDGLPGWGQDVGLDLRAPFRFKFVEWARASGAFKVGPQFNVGKLCRHCSTRALGLGVAFGFVTDISLPKLFKLIVGVEQQLGLWNWRNRNANSGDTRFRGVTWVDLGLEAFWREKIFFTFLFNVGAQYGSSQLHDHDHAVFRQMVGAGYKWH